MRKYLCLGLLCVSFIFPVMGNAADRVEWDRNTESDMSHYRIYLCQTLGCTVQQNSTMLQSTSVAQPPVGSKPFYLLPATKEGSVAISAVDVSGNESGISVSVPFDLKAPLIPVNPVVK